MPRRLRPAKRLAWAATLVAIGLAALPRFLGPADYDPAVAVLTATLVTVVWYTFFAFWAATREDPSFLHVELERDGLALQPIIRNPTRRTINLRVTMRLWIGDEEIPQSEFYRGAEPLVLTPEGLFRGCVDVQGHFFLSINEFGRSVPEQDEVRVMLWARWTDDLDETGEAGPRFFRVPYYGDEVVSVVAQTNIDTLFPTFDPDASSPQEPLLVDTELSYGFVRTTSKGTEVCRIQRPLGALELVSGKKHESESLSGGVRDIVLVGGGYVRAVVAPADLRPPLSSWLGHGGSVEVDFASDVDLAETNTPCTILADSSSDVEEPGWDRRPLAVRIAPRGNSAQDLFEAVKAAVREGASLAGRESDVS